MGNSCPVWAPFLGALGVVFAISLCCLGAAYGTAKSGTGIFSMGVMRPELIMKSIIPVVMAGIVGIYGVVVSVFLSGRWLLTLSVLHHVLDHPSPSFGMHRGSLQFAAGLAVGLCGLAAGIAIGIVGEAGVKATAQQSKLFVAMVLILIFAEVLGLYGLIVAVILDSKAATSTCF